MNPPSSLWSWIMYPLKNVIYRDWCQSKVILFCSNCHFILFKLSFYFVQTVMLLCLSCYLILFELLFYFH